MSQKLSYIAQIEVVEYNMRRLKTLIEADFEPSSDVNLYCILKSKIQLENLEKEIFHSQPTMVVKGLDEETSQALKKLIEETK